MSTEEPVSCIPIKQAKESEENVSTLTMMHAECVQINTTEEFDSLARLADDLFNKTNYRMRHIFFKVVMVLLYFEPYKEFKVLVNMPDYQQRLRNRY